MPRRQSEGKTAAGRRSAFCGGCSSQNQDGSEGDEVYYMGLIDYLQVYNARKVAENVFKSMVHDGRCVLAAAAALRAVCVQHDRREISAVNPNFYAERLVAFLDKHVV